MFFLCSSGSAAVCCCCCWATCIAFHDGSWRASRYPSIPRPSEQGCGKSRGTLYRTTLPKGTCVSCNQKFYFNKVTLSEINKTCNHVYAEKIKNKKRPSNNFFSFHDFIDFTFTLRPSVFLHPMWALVWMARPPFLSHSMCGTSLVFSLCSALFCSCGARSPVRLSNRRHCWVSMQLTSPWYWHMPLTLWWYLCFSSICCTFVLLWTCSFLIHTLSEFPSTSPNMTVVLSVEAFTLHFSNNSFLRPSPVTTGSFVGALPKADSPSVLVHLLGRRGSHFLWEKPQSCTL